MISGLPGNASRTLVDVSRLAGVLKAEPVKLENKRGKPGILFDQFTHCFTLQTSDNDVFFDLCVDSASLAKFTRHGFENAC